MRTTETRIDPDGFERPACERGEQQRTIAQIVRDSDGRVDMLDLVQKAVDTGMAEADACMAILDEPSVVTSFYYGTVTARNYEDSNR